MLLQLLLAVGTIAINLFCILTLLLNKETRKLEFYLLLLQNIFDFIVSGLFSFVYSTLVLIAHYNAFCQDQQFYDNAGAELYANHKE